MRLCYLAYTSSIHARKWIKYFADRGHSVHVITCDLPPDDMPGVIFHGLKYEGVPFRVYPLSFVLNAVGITRELLKIIRDISPDLIHIHGFSSDALLMTLCMYNKWPILITAWGSDILIRPNEKRLVEWMVKIILKRVNLVTTDAHHVVQRLEALGANPEMVHIINFGTDVDKFSPQISDGDLRQKLGLGTSPAVISLRSLEPVYDIPTIFQAAQIVLREVPEAKFLIIGKGSQEAILRQQAVDLGISESIIFVGYVRNDELPKYLNSADIYVSVSLSDAGLAGSTSEAMACGLPVIVTDFGDNAAWVKDGVNGFTIPLRNPDILAERILYLIKNKEVGRRFGELSRQVICSNNNWNTEMGKMEKIYEELIERCKK